MNACTKSCIQGRACTCARAEVNERLARRADAALYIVVALTCAAAFLGVFA